MSEELKPCPFCGGNNLRFRLSDIEGWIAHVECTDCDDMLGPMSYYKYSDKEDAEQDAAAVWNRRPASAEPVKTVPSVAVKEDADFCKNSHGEVISLEEAVQDLLSAFRASPTSHQAIGYRSDLWTILAECLKARRSALSAQVHDASVQDVVDELRRQVEVEGWSADHDDTHDKGEMAGAAACYALAGVAYVAPDHYPPRKKYAAVVDARNSISEKERETTREAIKLALGEPSAPRNWPWDTSWWKPTNTRRNLVKAAALLISEIKRLDRAAAALKQEG